MIIHIHFPSNQFNFAQLDFGLTYCSNGDLLSLIKKLKKFTVEKATFYAAEITLALEYMHSKNVIHR
jgi:serine/threonine protein kinase